jgi:hypothetical protein
MKRKKEREDLKEGYMKSKGEKEWACGQSSVFEV